jgi:hypothetical protein
MRMKKCENCGEPTYLNTYFSREVCPYCGWMASVSAKTSPKKLIVKNDHQGGKKILLPV